MTNKVEKIKKELKENSFSIRETDDRCVFLIDALVALNKLLAQEETPFKTTDGNNVTYNYKTKCKCK